MAPRFNRRIELARRLCIVFTLVTALSSAAAHAARAAFQDFAQGAVGAWNTCTPRPNGDLLCSDFHVFYYADQSNTTGAACFEHFEALIHPDGTADELPPEFGCAYPVGGAYDRSSLSFARMGGVTIALDVVNETTGEVTPTGRSVVLGPFEWTAASGVYVYGNDGPFPFGFDMPPRLLVDPCATAVFNRHQRFTTARVSGSIDGISVAAYGAAYLPWPGTGPSDALGAVFDLRLNIVSASHARSC